MSNNAPILDDPIGQSAETRNGPTANGHSAKDSFLSSAQSALDSVQSNPTAQNFKSTVTDGPVAQSVKNEYANTSNELRSLANARTRPSYTAETGQPLTHYHSMFYKLLSWENPRATAIAYLMTLAAIFATRYLPVVRTLFRVLYICFGVTAAAELSGKLLFNNGFASQMRPRRYYTLPKGTVDRFLDDVHELLNFFVIEFQRILFADNPAYTVAAFFTCLFGYYLTKLVPLWGLSVIGTTVLYLAPLIYFSNREMIDEQVAHLSRMTNEQTARFKDLAGQKTHQAAETVKHYAGDASAKANELMGTARQRTASMSGRAQENMTAAKDRTVSATKDYSAQAQDNLGAAKDRTVSATKDYSAQAQDNMGSAKDRTVSAGSEYTGQAQDTAANIKDRTAATLSDYTATAQQYLGAAKEKVVGGTGTQGTYYNNQGNNSYEQDGPYNASDFPAAPGGDPTRPLAEQYGEKSSKEYDPLAA